MFGGICGHPRRLVGTARRLPGAVRADGAPVFRFGPLASSNIAFQGLVGLLQREGNDLGNPNRDHEADGRQQRSGSAASGVPASTVNPYAASSVTVGPLIFPTSTLLAFIAGQRSAAA